MWPIWVAGSKHTRGSRSQPRMEGDAVTTSPGSLLQEEWSLEEVMTPVPATLYRCFFFPRGWRTFLLGSQHPAWPKRSMVCTAPTASDPLKRRTLPAERR